MFTREFGHECGGAQRHQWRPFQSAPSLRGSTMRREHGTGEGHMLGPWFTSWLCHFLSNLEQHLTFSFFHCQMNIIATLGMKQDFFIHLINVY